MYKEFQRAWSKLAGKKQPGKYTFLIKLRRSPFEKVRSLGGLTLYLSFLFSLSLSLSLHLSSFIYLYKSNALTVRRTGSKLNAHVKARKTETVADSQ